MFVVEGSPLGSGVCDLVLDDVSAAYAYDLCRFEVSDDSGAPALGASSSAGLYSLVLSHSNSSPWAALGVEDLSLVGGWVGYRRLYGEVWLFDGSNDFLDCSYLFELFVEGGCAGSGWVLRADDPEVVCCVVKDSA